MSDPKKPFDVPFPAAKTRITGMWVEQSAWDALLARVEEMEARCKLHQDHATEAEVDTGNARLAHAKAELKLQDAEQALDFYASRENWEYTDGAGQFDWSATIKKDTSLSPEVGEGGGTDYAGKRARECLQRIRGKK